MEFAVPAEYSGREIKENEKRGKYLDLAREVKKAMKYEGDGDTSCNWWLGMFTKSLVKGQEELEIGGWRAEII